MRKFDFSIPENPEIFEINRLPGHSDHLCIEDSSKAAACPGAKARDLLKMESDLKVSLNGSWKFFRAPDLNSVPLAFTEEDFDAEGWDEIRVPGHIELQGYGRPQYVNVQYPWDGSEEIVPGQIPKRNPVGCYIRDFELPRAAKEGRELIISFQGVESGMALFVNGQFVGYAEDSFTPSEFNLTPYVHDGLNRLMVMVFRFTSGSWCEDQDFFRFSGIFRDVYLYTLPEVHLRDLEVRTILDDHYENADLNLRLFTTSDGRVRISLFDETGALLYAKEKAIVSEEKGENAFSVAVSHPRLWSAEKPVLYGLRLELFNKAGSLVETVFQSVGFRSFEIRDGIMLINGQRIVFKGVNRHEFSAQSGRCINEEIIRKDLITCKRNNINALRTSHYPNRSEFYRLADYYGLYIIDETNLETHGSWNGILFGGLPLECAVPGDRENFREMIFDRGRSMFLRDRNHPSVLIWSLGNESFGGSVLKEFHDRFKEWDPTRPIHYEGIFNDRRYPETSDIESTMYVPVDEIRKWLKTNRTKPYINCEYMHSMGNSTGAMNKYTELAYEDPLFQGGFIWDYIDQCLMKKDAYGRSFAGYGGDFGDRPTDFDFSGNGIVYGPDREPTPKMQEVRFNYQNVRMDFSSENGRIRMNVENRNLFTDLSEMKCVVRLEREGVFVSEKEMKVSVAPLDEDVFDLPYGIPGNPGEYTYTVSFLTKEDQPWAPAGHEVAWGQYTVRVNEKPHTDPLFARMKQPEEKTLPVKPKVIHGAVNIGVEGPGFRLLFSSLFGGPVSARYAGKEYIERIPRPNFWRAMTQNDIANLQPSRSGQWKAASLYATHRTNHGRGLTPYEITETDHSVKLVYTYHLPVVPAKDAKVSYEVFGDGRVETVLSMDPSADVGELPAFDMLFTLPLSLDRIRWYGLGPEETYFDRCSAKLGIYEKNVRDTVAANLVPQETGSHLGTRWAEILDSEGHGLVFECGGLELSALPWSPEELDYAKHPTDLPLPQYTIVRVGRMMGIGGDDTWGALVHPEYRLDNTERMEIRFSFKGI